MKSLFLIPSSIALTLLSASAQVAAPAADQPSQEQTKLVAGPDLQKELEQLNTEKQIREAKLQAELAEMQAEISRLKAKRELLAEQQQLESLKQQAAHNAKVKAAQALEEKLERDAAIAKAKASIAASNLALEKTKLSRDAELQEAEIQALKLTKERQNYADAKPVYLDKPLKDDGTLVISDRRIALNGAVTSDTADYITERIHYFNNKDKKKPIFIVIDDSPGGSVMAGYRILKAMDGSDAPVHVVVKSFAASMAATIATLAEESYAYPNALILHHQLSSSYFFTTMNLTQQKEAYNDSKKWWNRLASPIAKKMGISTDEFIKQMYQNNSNGDWVEFADEAKKLKWINHVVKRIQETALDINPDSIEKKKEKKESTFMLKETLDEQGRPVMYLPRINPHDVYFLYNPDGYYRLKK